MNKQLMVLIGLLLSLLTACGTSKSRPDKMISGIVIEFIPGNGVQPHATAIDITVRLKDIQGITFAPLTFQSSGVISFTQPSIQSLADVKENVLDIPLTLVISGTGEGTFRVAVNLADPKNLNSPAHLLDFKEFGTSNVLYIYVTNERVYTGVGGGMTFLKKQDMEYRYANGSITQGELDTYIQSLSFGVDPPLLVDITPTMK